MVRIVRNSENNLVAVVGTHVSGEEYTIQYKSDSPFSYLPGPGSNPRIERIYDLAGGFNLRRDGAQSIIRSHHPGFTSNTSYTSTLRFKDSVPELMSAFREAGFPEPPVTVPLSTRIARSLTHWTAMPRAAL